MVGWLDGFVGENLTDDELHEMIDEADRDGDAMINEEEFYRVRNDTTTPHHTTPHHTTPHHTTPHNTTLHETESHRMVPSRRFVSHPHPHSRPHCASRTNGWLAGWLVGWQVMKKRGDNPLDDLSSDEDEF